MISDIEDYFSKGCGRCERFATPQCSVRQWQTGLSRLRLLCVEAGLTETVKWGHPCYMAHGRNIAVIGGFRGDFRLSFFNASLMRDPQSILEKQGPGTQYPDMIRFLGNGQPEQMAPVIAAYLSEAIGYAELGIRPAKSTLTLELPAELADALDHDPELAEAFHALTPGRRKSYVINLNSAKRPETRVARIVRFRDRIIAGKGALER